MAADDVRAQIHEALSLRGFRPSAELADVLLPVVDRIAREAAGKALRDAADAESREWKLHPRSADRVRARAEAVERTHP